MKLSVVCAVLFLSAGPVFAEPSCDRMTVERATQIAHEVVTDDPTATFTVYTGKKAAAIMAAVNAEEPVTDWAADHILVIAHPEEPVYRVALGNKGCIIFAFKVPKDGWDKIVSGAKGAKPGTGL